MAIFFNGWLGYGTAVVAGILGEPADPAYVRRPIVLGDLNSGIVGDVGSGTVGPASVAWGSIGFMALFDAQSSGNMLLWLPLRVPIVIQIGNTITTGNGGNSFNFSDLRGGVGMTRVWPTGSIVATTVDGRALTAGVPLQATGGLLSAQALAFGSTVTMAALPQAQPVLGSGQLWNNGGVISVA